MNTAAKVILFPQSTSKKINYRFLFFVTLFIMAQSVCGQVRKPLTEKENPVSSDKLPDYLWQKVKKDPFTKEHFGWKLAFIQHPMYLIIDEDRGEPAVMERFPPWGASNAEDYAGRVRRNLNSLDELPGLKLNYEWSAVELESITNKFPDILSGMRRQFRKGSLDFVNGSYSQSHLQVLGSESNWRQFDYGLELYRDLFDEKVTVYATQETGVHQQLPQILKKFNYEYQYLPHFPHTLEFIDGSVIPTYLNTQASDDNLWNTN